MTMTTPDARWYVVQTHAHAEAKAAAHLQRQGYPVYLPRCGKRRRHARRVETVAAPMFPRYLFVAVDRARQRWRAISSTIGVAHLVCNGEGPAAVPAGVVEELRAREDAQGLIRLERRACFARGEQVRLTEGVFASCLALFDGMADGERVAVLLDLLGRKARVVVDRESVAAA
jgi:transcriptional antiterminator RfaH